MSTSSSWVEWIPRALHPTLRKLITRSLRLGPLPQHVAFIMDGNRRFARERNEPVRVGHEEGFEALKRILHFFLELGVGYITVYAFSIENFNREPHEVDALMDLARRKLIEISEKGCVSQTGARAVADDDGCSSLLDRHDVQIRVLGRRDLLPPDVQDACSHAEAMTAGNRTCVSRRLRWLRATLSHTPQTRPEFVLSVHRARGNREFGRQDRARSGTRRRKVGSACSKATGRRADMGCCSDIDEKTLERHLYTAGSPPLDLLIRTSGVSRLSDFLLWQADEETQLHFIAPNWPDLGVSHILPALLSFQAQRLAQLLRYHKG